MIIINSGAYLPPELQAEFGPIPSCFIPLANKKLFEYQVSRLRDVFLDDKIIISLPESYTLSSHESMLMQNFGVTTIATRDEFTLGEALLFILNTNIDDSYVRILHGDTLFLSFDKDLNIVSVSKTYDNYAWEKEIFPSSEEEHIWTGYFAFSSSRDLMKCLALSRGDFVRAVRQYMSMHSVEARVSVGWMDLGHVNTYFRARTNRTSERDFNSLQINDNVVTKKSSLPTKIIAESTWFETIPTHLKKYTPQLISKGIEGGVAFYKLEYLPLSPLNELFVHGRNPLFFWKYVFEKIKLFLCDARSGIKETFDIHNTAIDLYINKTKDRLALYNHAFPIEMDVPLCYAGKQLPSLTSICDDCFEAVFSMPHFGCILHGDMCLSNILIDLRADNIKLIDPRGHDNRGTITPYGDQKYDLAKLMHSFIGLYDFIISGYFQLSSNSNYEFDITFSLDERIEAIQDGFLKFSFIPGFDTDKVMPLVILLFISMIPLHDDSMPRKKAIFANALRLYADYRGYL